ncbi:DUF4179 domain-containing protein [Planococcus sp. FY231025]|uniref:DUF4179 domain-containing protein n=1 Tax=Planococcus sp. FY231025 TaxID=3455699 RepID=UPI003F8F20DE
MFEREEQQLAAYRKEIEEVHLPLDGADDAIASGIRKAKKEQQKRRVLAKRSFWSLTAAAIAMIVLVSTIRASPAFAQTVSGIPGVAGIVEMIRNDKGLASIIENDFYQEIEASQTIDGLTLAIEGVILDESGMNIYYKISSDEPLEGLALGKAEIENKTPIPPSSISMGAGEAAGSEYSDYVAFHFENPIRFEELDFTFKLDVGVKGKSAQFAVPFELSENVRQGQKFVLNENVEIESQKMTIHEVTIHPLRTEVVISFDPANSKKILHIEDLRLEDENGEIWGSARNGRSSHGEPGEKMVYYLQSNYFKEPEELHLRFNELQAVDKGEASLLVDVEKQQLLRSPSDGQLNLAEADKKTVRFVLNGLPEKEFNYGLISEIVDADGKKLHVSSESMAFKENNEREWLIELENVQYKNPIKMKLFAYPSYITGEGDIELER